MLLWREIAINFRLKVDQEKTKITMSLFHKKIFDPNPDFFGLDLSDLSVKVAQIEKKGKYQSVVGVGSVDLKQGYVVDGGILNEGAVVEAIHAALKKANITVKDVICSLPETKAFLRIITIPIMTHDEVGEAIKWEMEAHIPMSIDQVYYDWQELPEHLHNQKGKMSVLVVAVAQAVVDQFLSVLNAAGLNARGFEVESLAQSRSMLAESSGTTEMIVDIGDRRTSFLVVVDGVPVFTSSIPLCAESMTDAIAKTMNLSHVEAEKVKFAHGIGSVLKDDHIFQAMQPIIGGFVQEINKSINFYLTGLRYSKNIDNIVLCGGGAKTKGLIPYLSRSLGRNIELGNPWVNVTFKGLPPIEREASVQYATAIGLATKESEVSL